jgi:hypothetical protein
MKESITSIQAKLKSKKQLEFQNDPISEEEYEEQQQQNQPLNRIES